MPLARATETPRAAGILHEVAEGGTDQARGCACSGEHLTAREIDVVVRTAAGLSARQIAVILHISHRTVEYHIASILKRIAARNTVEAVARCYATGVLMPSEWPPRWSGRFCARSDHSINCPHGNLPASGTGTRTRLGSGRTA